jgi:hypothetical protein
MSALGLLLRLVAADSCPRLSLLACHVRQSLVIGGDLAERALFPLILIEVQPSQIVQHIANTDLDHVLPGLCIICYAPG